jgi:hypothetical protein
LLCLDNFVVFKAVLSTINKEKKQELLMTFSF